MPSSEKSKFEITVIVRKDDEFVSRDIVKGDDVVLLNSQLEFVIEGIRRRLEGKAGLLVLVAMANLIGWM